MSKAKDEYYKILDSDKIELTEEQFREVWMCGCKNKDPEGSVYLKALSEAKSEGMIVQTPIEKAKQHVIQLHEIGVIGELVYAEIMAGFHHLEERITDEHKLGWWKNDS